MGIERRVGSGTAVVVALAVAGWCALPSRVTSAQSTSAAPRSCRPRHIRIVGGHARSCCRDPRAYWDGNACVEIGGCYCGGQCVGADCADLFADLAACRAAFQHCRGRHAADAAAGTTADAAVSRSTLDAGPDARSAPAVARRGSPRGSE